MNQLYIFYYSYLCISLVDNFVATGDYGYGYGCSTLDSRVEDCDVAIDGYWSGVNGYDTYQTGISYQNQNVQGWTYSAFERQVAYIYYTIAALQGLTESDGYNHARCFGGDWLCNNGLLMTDGTGGAIADPITFYQVGRPANNLEGEVQGIEVAWQHLFDNGYGVQFNYIVTEGDNIEADLVSLDEQFYIPGLADSGNFAAFYEDNKMTARLGINYAAERPSGSADYFNREVFLWLRDSRGPVLDRRDLPLRPATEPCLHVCDHVHCFGMPRRDCRGGVQLTLL